MKFIAWLDGHLINDWRTVAHGIAAKAGLLSMAGIAVWEALTDEQHAALLDLVHVDPKWALPVGVVCAVYLRLKG